MEQSKLPNKLHTKNKQGVDILIEWEQVALHSAHVIKTFHEFSQMLVHAYVPVEKEYAKTYPDSIGQDRFLNVLEPLFKKGINHVEWSSVEKKIADILGQFFTDGFAKSILANKDIFESFDHLMVTARNKLTREPLG